MIIKNQLKNFFFKYYLNNQQFQKLKVYNKILNLKNNQLQQQNQQNQLN